ncbi:hypothetical protein [Rheinheimera gaetbuli]
MTTLFTELMKDSAYRLEQFKQEKIDQLESAISLKQTGKKFVPYVNCIVRGKPIKLTPEEAIRQLYLLVLRDDLGYVGLLPLAPVDAHLRVSDNNTQNPLLVC